MTYQWTDEAERQARSKLDAIEAGRILGRPIDLRRLPGSCGVTAHGDQEPGSQADGS